MIKSSQSGFVPLLIIVAIIVALTTGAVIVAPKILRQNTSPPPSPETSEMDKTISQENSPATVPSENNEDVPYAAPYASPVSNSGNSDNTPPATSNDNTRVNVYVRSDQKAFFVDFYVDSTGSSTAYYYNLNYDTDEGGTVRGFEGTFTPTGTTITGYDGGRPYVRRELVLGTCSKSVCKYDHNPRSFKLTVKTTPAGGTTQIKSLTPSL